MKQVSNNNFITQIKTLLQNARNKVYQNINEIMTKTYYEIGKKIVEEEQLGSSSDLSPKKKMLLQEVMLEAFYRRIEVLKRNLWFEI
jgi:hypothetical protein